MKPWLTANPSNSPTLLFNAGQSAELAGKWSDAVTFYRKFLKGKSLDARLAGTATNSVYRLLINNMKQPEAAYLLMREDGDRLRGYGQAKQFDIWFLTQAQTRTDVAAIANRLAAIYNSNDPVERFAPFELFMLSELQTYKHSDKTTIGIQCEASVFSQLR